VVFNRGQRIAFSFYLLIENGTRLAHFLLFHLGYKSLVRSLVTSFSLVTWSLMSADPLFIKAR
jgi:hypothetical protein